MATAIANVYPTKINQATTNTAGGVNLGPIVAVTNKATGGTIGSAATTIDVASIFNVTQTTASQTLTVADPTVAGENKIVTINNIGSQSFTFTGTGLSTTIPAGHGIVLQWTGAAYSLMDGGGGSSTTPASVASTGAITSSSATAGIGYATGAGGTVTQATDKSTTVVLNKISGNVITTNASLAANATVSFTLTNSTIAAADVIVVSVKSGASTGLYRAAVTAVAAGSCQISITNFGSTAGEVVTINFAVIKAVAA